MNIEILFERIEALCAQKGITKTKAYIDSGVGKNFAHNINAGKAPSVEKVIALAQYFNVPVDYLLGRDIPHESAAEISPREQLLIDAYRQLSPENKVRLSERADALLDEQRRAIAQDA